MVRICIAVALLLAAFTPDLHAAALATHATASAAHPWMRAFLIGGSLFAAGTVLDATMMTLVDYAKLLDPNDQVARIINLLAQKNEMLMDMPFMEGNLITGHRTTVLTGLPAVYFRLLNQPVPTSKETTAQITEQTGMLEAYSEVDKKLADLGGNAGGVRLSKAKAFLEAMSQEMQSTVIYGSAAAPEEFIGLAPRYSDTSAGNGDNVIKAGGTGSTDNTSIWLIEWGDDQLAGIYPKGSKAGIMHEDLGIETKQSSAGLMRVYRDHWSLGLRARADGLALCRPHREHRRLEPLERVGRGGPALLHGRPRGAPGVGHRQARVLHEPHGPPVPASSDAERRRARGRASRSRTSPARPWRCSATRPSARTDAILNTEDVVV
jgi:hypothetical protein